MVRSDTGAREGTITAPQIQNLSIVSRGAMELLKIQPGTVTPDQTTMETVGFNFGGANSLWDHSVNGNRGAQMSPVLDGSKIIDFGSNGGVMLNINPDMVEEVKIHTGNYAAEYGAPSIQVSAVTKGGSDPETRYNYAFNAAMPINRWQLTSRVDWNVTESTHAYVRLALEKGKQTSERGYLWGDYSTFALPSRTVSDNNTWSVAATVTSVLSPQVTNEVVVSASQLKLDNDWKDPSKMSASALGLGGFQGVFPGSAPWRRSRS